MSLFRITLALLFIYAFMPEKSMAQVSADTAVAKQFGDSAEARMVAGDYNKAVYYYNKQINTHLKLGVLYYNRANAESFLGEYANAAHDYDTCLALDSTLKLAYMNQAYMYMQMNKPKEAMADYEKGMKASNDSMYLSNMHISRGNALLSMDDLKNAEEDFSAAIRYNKNTWQAYLQRGAVRHKFKKDKEALADLNTANSLKPKNPDILLLRGIVKYESGMYKAAIADLTVSLKIIRNNEGFFYRGISRMKLGQDSLAKGDFDNILSNNKNNLAALNSRAEANFRLKHPYLAIKDYSTIISLKPESGDAYANRAYVYTQLKEMDKACKDWHKAEKLGVDKAKIAIRKYCTQ